MCVAFALGAKSGTQKKKSTAANARIPSIKILFIERIEINQPQHYHTREDQRGIILNLASFDLAHTIASAVGAIRERVGAVIQHRVVDNEVQPAKEYGDRGG